MAKYSDLAEVDAAFGRWVREEEPEGVSLYPSALARPALDAALQALDPDVRVLPIVDATVEHSLVTLAVKAGRILPEGGLHYAQLNAHLSRMGRLALLRWEWRRSKSEPFPTFGAAPPITSARASALQAGAAKLLEGAGVPLVPFEEAERVVRVSDDPRYEGEYYEIRVFEALFGMGYPEAQR